MALVVSTLYKLTWKDRATPLHRSICVLRGSVRRTSGNVYGSWPTPTTRDHKGGYQGGRIRNGKISTATLDVPAQSAGWTTPSAPAATRGGPGLTAGPPRPRSPPPPPPPGRGWRRPEARSRQIEWCKDVYLSFHVSLYKVDPIKAVFTRNLFSKDRCRSALADEVEPVWE